MNEGIENGHHAILPSDPDPSAVSVVPDAYTAASASTPWSRDDAAWQRVSPAYAWADLVLNLLFVLVVAAILVFVVVINSGEQRIVPLIVLGVVVVALFVNALFAFRRVRAIGYVLREDDLLFRRGIMFERVVAVPYGRLQLVDVTRGPLMRAMGLATLKFVTASAATGVQLPGLKIEDAEALRDRLVELAEIRRSGL